MGDVVFRHPLVRAAVIHQASAQDRRDAHAHLAGLYEDVVVRRATHLSAAATGPDQQVADLLDQAARQSIRRGGSAVAVDWLRRAAELSTEPARRVRLLADAAFVASQSSRFDDAQTFVDTAQAVGDESPSAVLTGAYLALYRDGDVPAGHRRVLAALRRPDVLDDETLSRMVKLLLAMTQYSADAGLWRQTVDAIGRLGDRVQPESLIYRDAWGDVARTGHTVRDRLAEHVGRLSDAGAVGGDAAGGGRLLRRRAGGLPGHVAPPDGAGTRPWRGDQRDDDAAPGAARPDPQRPVGRGRRSSAETGWS